MTSCPANHNLSLEMLKRPSWPSLAALDHGILGSEEENEST